MPKDGGSFSKRWQVEKQEQMQAEESRPAISQGDNKLTNLRKMRRRDLRETEYN